MTVSGRLFDADGTDKAIEADQPLVARVTDRQLLWVDLDIDDPDELQAVADVFGLSRTSIRALLDPGARPRLDISSGYFELSVVAVGENDEPLSLALFVGKNWVVTAHRARVPFIEEFRQRLSEDTELGLLSAPSFTAALLDWHVATYFNAVDAIEHDVDDLDDRALRARDQDKLLRDLIRMRRRIGVIRRMLTPHRDVFAALARPDFETIATSASAPHFLALVGRLDRAIAAVENARELLIGSFDIFMTRTSQRTNEVMRTLTIFSAILLPAAVIAGVMGMNFRVPLFDEPSLFYVVVAAMGVIAVIVLVLARARRWI